MATTNQLERIGALTERLEPLSQKTRGMRIEADDWNGLVDVMLGLLQVERAALESTQVSLAERFSLNGHQHLGEVSVSWLDAELQSRLGGQEGSVSTRTSVADLQKKVDALSGEVARLTALVGEQQRQLDRASVNELDRGRILKQFDDRFSGVENLRTLVGTLSADVRGVNGNIGALLELRKSLSDADGTTIDIGRMRTEVRELQGLRDVLKGADGDLIKLRDVELKLQELSDAAGIGGAGKLDLRIAGVVSDAEIRIRDKNTALIDSLRGDLTAAGTLSETRLRGELTTKLQAAATASDVAATQKVTAAEARLGSLFDAKLSDSATQSRAATLAAAGALVDQRLAVLPAQIRSAATTALTELRPQFQADVRATLNADIDSRFAGVKTDVGKTLGTMETRLRTVEERNPGLIQSTVDTFGLDLEARLARNLDTRFSDQRTSIDTSVTQQIKTAASDVFGNVDTQVDKAVTRQLVDLDARIDRSVVTATRNQTEDISKEVKSQIESRNLPKLIDDKNAALAQTLRTEQAQARADQQARTSADLNDVTAVLRGETAALRTEMTKTIDTRVAANNTVLRSEISASVSKFESRLKPDVFRSNVVLNPVILR